jgi:GTP pyrophosphokinase
MEILERYNEVFANIQNYIHRISDLELIDKAFHFAHEKHKNQFRKSGLPYIAHPIEVAGILANMHAGPNTIAAGFLHDVVEDTDTSLQIITEEFNEDIASLVEGMTKLDKLNFKTEFLHQAENQQKMLIAMSKDIRVILIKLADRLHNMRTMDAMPPEKQQRISKETLEIFAPIAHKLGMNILKAELEDTSFKYINPESHALITDFVNNKKQYRESLIDNMKYTITEHFANSQLHDFEIKGRIKNTYSIYKKLVTQNKTLDDIYDIFALRIIVDKIETCYQALGIIHAHFVPIPKRFKDYIAVPKPNMYQSLHTTILAEDGELYEIQIRTKEMDDVAENGVAAHWAYKENLVYSKEKEQVEIASTLKWYGDLLKMSENKEVDNAYDFVNTFKGDLLDANVYVFTPNGEVIDLPKGATPLDFAYKIHTDLGHKTVGALVNNKMVTLDFELNTGDVVSIKTNKNFQGPSEDWLKIVKTNQAKHKIKAFLNKQNKENLYNSGKNRLEKELIGIKTKYELNDQFVKENYGKNGINTVSELYVELGKEIIKVKNVVSKLTGIEGITSEEIIKKQMEKSNRILNTVSASGVVIEGLTNPQVKLANCCLPVPGEEICGFVSKNSGVVVHSKSCPNILNIDENRLLDVYWANNPSKKYPIRLKISTSYSQSSMGEIVNIITSSNVQIASVQVKPNYTKLEEVFKFKLLTNNIKDFQILLINLQKVKNIIKIERDFS